MTIKQKKTIAIAATGGTIAGTGEAGKTAVYHAGEMNVESISGDNPDDSECCRY